MLLEFFILKLTLNIRILFANIIISAIFLVLNIVIIFITIKNEKYLNHSTITIIYKQIWLQLWSNLSTLLNYKKFNKINYILILILIILLGLSSSNTCLQLVMVALKLQMLHLLVLKQLSALGPIFLFYYVCFFYLC